MKIEEVRDRIRKEEYEISFHAEKERYAEDMMKEQGQEEVRRMHKYGDCSFCGGEVKEEKVELDYRYKGKLFIFQNVPARACQQCAEKYLTAKVAKEIGRRILTKEKWDKTVSVPVDVLPEETAA